MADELHDLTDQLGEEHDLAVLSGLAQPDVRHPVKDKTNHPSSADSCSPIPTDIALRG